MPHPSENDSFLDSGHNPAPDSVPLLTENESRTSPGSVGSNTTKNHHTLCYFSHGCLFALHAVLLVVYIYHAEHRITITSATVADIVATMLTVSLQAFYTVYTAVLVFVTQRLALSYNFSRRQKLTSIHDISEAWIGIGAAMSGLWDQTTLSTAGISNATIYDLVSRNLGFGKAIINATTISASCGLFNLSVVQDSAADSIVVSAPNDDFLLFSAFPQMIWRDQIRMKSAELSTGEYPTSSDSDIFVVLSTAIEVNSSVQNPTTILGNWTYFDMVDVPDNNTLCISTTKIFMTGCTLSTNTEERYIDVQTNELIEAALLPDANRQWTPWIPQNVSNLGLAISAVTQNTGPSSAIFESIAPGDNNSSPSILDAYLMSLLGLNATADAIDAWKESSSNPNVTLSPYQLENAVAKIAAEAIWMAGQLGGRDGGFSRSTSETSVMQYILQWRLNLNLAPLIVATLASFIAFILAIEMTGRIGTHKPDGSHTVKSASPLELLWLAAHMPGLTTGFKDIEKPTMNNLREAGMFDVCLIGSDVKILSDDDLNKDLGS
ncbi:hypothetical protein BJ138DRAFT_1131324 [Hygrophoropsis aurantiaca]|uniref:Uncharacterized protein n=1 Tax=Hygrophoropsis aurantiaca TaxID=72124 RepID=A0ACB7ZR22_9AGAM|nr:hypothetical protein BJ138DRAFT_1131324 [Hygrophoropsis aurantiaca]